MSEHPLLGELLSDARVIVRRLLDEPLVSRPELAAQLDAVASDIRLASTPHSLADWETGLDLVARAGRLLERWETLDHGGRRLVQVAVRYLALEDDGDSDLGSAFGFDDDAEVLGAVERALGV